MARCQCADTMIEEQAKKERASDASALSCASIPIIFELQYWIVVHAVRSELGCYFGILISIYIRRAHFFMVGGE